ncbi:Rid family detoxifying hydrolase [Blattabacterium cuenoti]|uniref:Rid family detoxifying hydrolase n=1 Tax=Blattabacterium cuenoti TaxID=1653831 RepID=UPI00163C2A01|nr:Rid family detoxifying hydrolase [Blattabacterium cuenoti]
MKPKTFSIKKISSFGPYSTCVLIENFFFISGQIGVDPDTGKLVDKTIEMETERVMKNLQVILSEIGIDFQNVIKSSIFFTKMEDFSKINYSYSKFFSREYYPARETIQVSGLPKNANIEISLIAYKKN